MDKVAEIVLPDGRFASLRRLTGLDVAIAGRLEYFDIAIIALAVEIDGRSLTYSEVARLDISVYLPISRMVNNYIQEVAKLTGVSK